MTSLLATLATQALEAVEDYYLANALPLPDRRLVSHGQSPWDCELLNVWVARDYPTDGGPEFESLMSIRPHPGHYFRAAVLGVQLVRCYPTLADDGSPPDADTEAQAAAELLADADQLWRALLEARDMGRFSQPNGVAYEGWTALGPDGGLAGGVLTCHALLPLPSAVAVP